MTKVIENKRIAVNFDEILTTDKINSIVEEMKNQFKVYEGSEEYESNRNSWINWFDHPEKGKSWLIPKYTNDLKTADLITDIQLCMDILIRIKINQQALLKSPILTTEIIKIKQELTELKEKYNRSFGIDLKNLKGIELGKYIINHFEIKKDNKTTADYVNYAIKELGFENDEKDKIRSAVRSAQGLK